MAKKIERVPPAELEERRKLHLRQLKERAPGMHGVIERELVRQGIKMEWIRQLEADPEYQKLKDMYYERLAKILAKYKPPE